MSIHNIIDDIYPLEIPVQDNESKLQVGTEVSEGNLNILGNETDSSTIIDTSWMDDFSRMQHIYNNQQRELMNTISASFIYINKNNYIEKIITETVDLEISDDSKFSFLSKENLLKIIQNKKLSTQFSKYIFSELLSFVVDLEPEFIQDFFTPINYSKGVEHCIDERFFKDKSATFLKVLSIFNNVRIEQSIFIFRNINHLYFLFNESENHSTSRYTLRSILKGSGSGSGSGSGHTKKVHIVPSSLHTKKNRK